MNRTGTVELKNFGSNPFDVWLMITGVESSEITQTAPELKEDPTTFYHDIDSVIHYGLKVGSNENITYAENLTISAGAHNTSGETQAVRDQWIYLGRLEETGSTIIVNQSFGMDYRTTNWAQADRMTFDVIFSAQQAEGDIAPPILTPELPHHGRADV